MITHHKINLDWITGLMFGIEFLFDGDMEPENGVNMKFGCAIDLGIIRILYMKLQEVPK